MWEKKGGNGSNSGSQPYSKISESKVGGVEIGDLVGPTEKDALDMILSKEYAYPSVSSFSMVGQSILLELGYKLEGTKSFAFSFSNSQNVLDNTVHLKQSGTTLKDQQPKSSTISTTINTLQFNTPASSSFRIEAENTRNNIFGGNLTFNWMHSVYYGVAENKDIGEITADFIKNNLTRELRNSHVDKIEGNIGLNQRMYYAYPVSMGIRYLETLLGVEGDSLLISGGLDIKTASQIAFNLNGVEYAVCKNEQSNLGQSKRTLTTI